MNKVINTLDSEAEIAVHRRLNLINGDLLTGEELIAETKGLVAELKDIFKKQIENEFKPLTDFYKKMTETQETEIPVEIQNIIADNFWEML